MYEPTSNFNVTSDIREMLTNQTCSMCPLLSTNQRFGMFLINETTAYVVRDPKMTTPAAAKNVCNKDLASYLPPNPAILLDSSECSVIHDINTHPSYAMSTANLMPHKATRSLEVAQWRAKLLQLNDDEPLYKKHFILLITVSCSMALIFIALTIFCSTRTRKSKTKQETLRWTFWFQHPDFQRDVELSSI